MLRRALTAYTRQAKGAAPLRLLFTAILGIAIIIGMVAGLSTLMALVVHGPHGRQVLVPTLTWGLSVTSVFIFFYAILAVLAVFTYSSDLELLLLTPLSPRLILGDKFVTVSGGFFLLLLFMGAPVLMAIGHSLHLGWSYDLAAITALFLLPIPPVAVAMVITLMFLRWLPPARARAIVVTAGTCLFVVFFSVTRTVGTTSGRLPTSFVQLDGLWSFVPITWPGHFLAAVGLGQQGAALLYLQGMLAMAAVLGWGTVHLSAHMFALGWAGYQEVGRRPRPLAKSGSGRRVLAFGLGDKGTVMPTTFRTASRPAAEASLLRDVRWVWWPLFTKEWLVLRRDPQILGQLALPFVLALFSVQRVFFSGAPHSEIAGHSAPTEGWFFGTLAFSSLFLLSFLALSIVNREGRSLQILSLAPLTARDILFGKWAFCAFPTLVIEELLLIGGAIRLGLSPLAALFGAASLAVLIIALAGALISISLLWPRLHPDNARQPVSFTGCLAGSIAGSVLAGSVALSLMVISTLGDSVPAFTVLAVTGAIVFPSAVTWLVASAAPKILRGLLVSDSKPR
jgi:ABC-2 type transport system permease protein